MSEATLDAGHDAAPDIGITDVVARQAHHLPVFGAGISASDIQVGALGGVTNLLISPAGVTGWLASSMTNGPIENSTGPSRWNRSDMPRAFYANPLK